MDTKKLQKIQQESDDLCTQLGEHWGVSGVFMLVAMADPLPGGSAQIGVASVAWGCDEFQENLAELLRESAARAGHRHAPGEVCNHVMNPEPDNPRMSVIKNLLKKENQELTN